MRGIWSNKASLFPTLDIQRLYDVRSVPNALVTNNLIQHDELTYYKSYGQILGVFILRICLVCTYFSQHDKISSINNVLRLREKD